MTLTGFVATRLINELPLTVVSLGVLSTDQELAVGVSTHPYGLMFNMPDVEVAKFGDGSSQKARVTQLLLESRPVTDENGLHVPDLKLMMDWYDLMADAPDYVTEIRKGVPLDSKLKYVGGLGEPATKAGVKDWLISGLNFEQVFTTRH